MTRVRRPLTLTPTSLDAHSRREQGSGDGRFSLLEVVPEYHLPEFVSATWNRSPTRSGPSTIH